MGFVRVLWSILLSLFGERSCIWIHVAVLATDVLRPIEVRFESKKDVDVHYMIHQSPNTNRIRLLAVAVPVGEVLRFPSIPSPPGRIESARFVALNPIQCVSVQWDSCNAIDVLDVASPTSSLLLSLCRILHSEFLRSRPFGLVLPHSSSFVLPSHSSCILHACSIPLTFSVIIIIIIACLPSSH